jgi:hypothetical protein
VRAGWSDVISDHAIGSCQPQRTEFRRSAGNLDEYEQMTSMFVVFKMPWPGDPRVNIQNKGGKAKPYQVKQVLTAVKKLEERS